MLWTKGERRGIVWGLGLELFEKAEQLVVRSKALGSTFDGISFGHGFFFQSKIGVEIDLGSFHRFIAEPKRNDRSIDPALQQLHSGCVAQNMG